MKTVRMKKKTYKEFSPTELTKAFDDFNIFFYLSGMSGFWVNEVKLPKKFVEIFDKVVFVTDKLCICGIISFIVALYIQDKMTPEQASELLALTVSMAVLHSEYYIFSYYRAEVRELLYYLVVVLKEHYYNKEEQLHMIKQMKFFVKVLTVSLLSFFTSKAATSVAKTVLYGDVFYPYVAVWPDVNYTSTSGLIGVISNYVLVFVITVRPNAVYAMSVVLLLTQTFQFKNLQCYFYNLDDIFKDNTLCQSEKEKKYEEKFKIGIHMHSVSLGCVGKIQHACWMIFSLQLLHTLFNLLMSMMIMISGDVSAKLTQALVVTILTGLAIYMWNAGNITYEAERVANAMYASGWQNCYGQSSVRVRKLVVNSMTVAQAPVVLKACGFVDMSYESYMAIIKFSYSLLSLFN